MPSPAKWFAPTCFSLLVATKLPLDELSTAHLVAMEVPSKATLGFERLLLRLVQQGGRPSNRYSSRTSGEAPSADDDLCEPVEPH